MRTMIETCAALLGDKSGVEAILLEMDRQIADAKESIETTKVGVRELAKAIKAHQSLLLLGMGASHFANELFALQLRKLGVQALAVSASEFLYDPLPTWKGPVLLTSQSGESVETVRCLPLLEGLQLFGITLNEESTIGRKTEALVAHGGAEKAFAGTRSVTLTITIMASVCVVLGLESKRTLEQALEAGPESQETLLQALGILSQAYQVIATGRSLFNPLAQLFALGCEELSRRSVLCLETGQLRHGPMEILGPDSALVVFRQDGTLGQLASSFEDLQKKAGFKLVVFDASSHQALEGSLTVRFPSGDDIFTVVGMMTAFQSLMIAFACTKNPQTGLPRYGSKVTITE
ncbi:MAG: SIS domain-containing protein [Sphaerochaeta sp.]|uniref:SIS domain-containing protein n=1 Tax=Sphaerochaeta sp. TaxID=1972642 RepID=UPI003D096354